MGRVIPASVPESVAGRVLSQSPSLGLNADPEWGSLRGDPHCVEIFDIYRINVIFLFSFFFVIKTHFIT